MDLFGDHLVQVIVCVCVTCETCLKNLLLFVFIIKNSANGQLLVWGPVVWASRGTPKSPNPFHFRKFQESKPPNAPNQPLVEESPCTVAKFWDRSILNP